MQIDPETGKVYFDHYVSPIITDKLKQSLEDLKIKSTEEEWAGFDRVLDKIDEDAVFQKTRHYGLLYGRLKYMLYCFLLVVDGLIGIVSFGQTQSIIAQKYLLSKWIMGDNEDGNR